MAWLRGAVLWSALLALAAAQMPGLGQCPQYVAKGDFNIQKFLGMWYESERMFQVLEVASRCLAAEYTQSSDGKVRVSNYATSRLTGIQRVLDGEVQFKGKDSDGKIIVKYNVIPVTTIDTEYTILDTDYESYAVLYHCSSPLPFFNTQNAWIMTRERLPSGLALQRAYGVLDKYNIPRSSFSKTIQDECESAGVAAAAAAAAAAASTAAPPSTYGSPAPNPAPAAGKDRDKVKVNDDKVPVAVVHDSVKEVVPVETVKEAVPAPGPVPVPVPVPVENVGVNKQGVKQVAKVDHVQKVGSVGQVEKVDQ